MHMALYGAGSAPKVLTPFGPVARGKVYRAKHIRHCYFGPDIRAIRPRVAAGFGAVAAYFLNSVFITCVQTLGSALALWMTSSSV